MAIVNFLVNFQEFTEQLFNEKLGTTASDFMYIKPLSQVICVVGK